jgi:hypothetical protein
MKKFIYQFIPKRFNYLLKNNYIIYNDKKLKSDYIINLIHELIIKYLFNKDTTNLKFNLWSIILRKNYGTYYNFYVNYLIDKKFIKLISNYYVSKKSKTYLVEYFDVNDLIRVKIYDNILIKKHTRKELEKSITDYNNSPIPLKIRKRLVNDLFEVKIDYNQSIEKLNSLKKENKINIEKFYRNLISVDNINIGNLFFKFDSHGRLHSNFTILKQEIRKNYLSFDSDNVCELDIKNSQPFFLSILMKKYIKNWEIIQDVERYFFFVNNGLLYDDIVQQETTIQSRNEAKLMVYKVLFGENGDFKKMSIIFKKLYPTVYDFISNFKKTNGNYKLMSHELQLLESNFIYNKLINRIYNEIPKIKIISIHDSIIFPCSFYKKVKDIFDYELNEYKK